MDWRGASGIAFDLTSTYVGVGIPTLGVRLVTNQSMVADDTMREGTCLPKPAQDPQLYCLPPHVEFSLKGIDKQTFTLKFSDFTGGKPSDMPDLDQVKRLEWAYKYASDQKPYDATFSIDNVTLLY